MVSLGGKLSSIESIMAELAERRASCRRMINELSSPTAKIPTEILIEIFQIACQPVDNGHRTRKTVTPLFIGSICRQWRDVAWSTPLLWNTIFLHVSRKNHDSQVQLLRVRLLNVPLSIKLTAEVEHESVLCAFEAIMQILVTRSDYWLNFDSPVASQSHNTFENINFPMLTSVSLHILKSITKTSHTHPVNNMFPTAPKLVDVNLIRYEAPVMFSWEQVRCFSLGVSTVAECLEVLRQSPSLEKCHFKCVYSPNSFISKTIVPHAQLRHLRVDSWSLSLFDSITLPSLSSLNIQCGNFKRLPLSSITSLILRSDCKLERLSINFPFDDVDLIPCLEAVPSLTYFKLHLETIGLYIGLTRYFLAPLDPLSNPSRLLLPNLKYFEFKGRVLCDCRTIVDMLSHRWHLSDDGSSPSSRVSKLKEAKILSTAPYHVPSDVQEEIRKLSEEGMLVKIESLVRN